MKAVRLLAGVVCGAACLALFSGCETQRSACERERRLTERMDEMQMDLDNRIQGVNMEVAGMRSNPPVVVQTVPAEPYPVVSQPDTIQITESYEDYNYTNKRAELERIAEQSRIQQLNPQPAPARTSASANTNRIRVPQPVRTIQAALRESGHYRGNVDGKVGPQTVAAITAFQRDHNLKADGIVGRQTWEALRPYAPADVGATRLK
ncbi:MAG: peptidoglycan-binding protein [Planctomycetes bacterium]|nr:peptidoglycan-binding protein [Planctomycetota bacterium]